MGKHYVYGHFKPSETIPFYIGKGVGNRAHSPKSRSIQWKNITNKYGLEVKILYDGLTNEQAIEYERRLIKEYGRLDLGTGNLINHTDGGEGGSFGRIFTEQTRRKISASKKGVKRPQEVCDMLSKVHKGKKISELHKEQISRANKGKPPWKKGIKNV